MANVIAFYKIINGQKSPGIVGGYWDSTTMAGIGSITISDASQSPGARAWTDSLPKEKMLSYGSQTALTNFTRWGNNGFHCDSPTIPVGGGASIVWESATSSITINTVGGNPQPMNSQLAQDIATKVINNVAGLNNSALSTYLHNTNEISLDFLSGFIPGAMASTAVGQPELAGVAGSATGLGNIAVSMIRKAVSDMTVGSSGGGNVSSPDGGIYLRLSTEPPSTGVIPSVSGSDSAKGDYKSQLDTLVNNSSEQTALLTAIQGALTEGINRMATVSMGSLNGNTINVASGNLSSLSGILEKGLKDLQASFDGTNSAPDSIPHKMEKLFGTDNANHKSLTKAIRDFISPAIVVESDI